MLNWKLTVQRKDSSNWPREEKKREKREGQREKPDKERNDCIKIKG